MAQTVYCRWCDYPAFVVAGDFPTVCEGCHREARWTTMAPVPSDLPRVPWELSLNDRRLLKSLRIAAE